MTALLAADACPACQNVHGQPTDWPTCPDHGHWLYVVSGPLNTGVWTYACQAPNCAYTHTQREKATMTAAPLVWCAACGGAHIPLPDPCPPAWACPDCHAPAGRPCRKDCPRRREGPGD